MANPGLGVQKHRLIDERPRYCRGQAAALKTPGLLTRTAAKRVTSMIFQVKHEPAVPAEDFQPCYNRDGTSNRLAKIRCDVGRW